MLESRISFSTEKIFEEATDTHPMPAKMNIPQWYKKLSHNAHKKTVKGCMPFLDAISAGYILRLSQDFILKHNQEIDKKEPQTAFVPSLRNMAPPTAGVLNLNRDPEIHGQLQVEGSPLLEKNMDFHIHKILNPWYIKTPPGYSCLFVPPLNNNDDRFDIISGIVDTDTFPARVNFPFVVNGYKYPKLDTVLKRGTPYAQVIPFKRQGWKMKLSFLETKDAPQRHLQNLYKIHSKLVHVYKSFWWNKKTWN